MENETVCIVSMIGETNTQSNAYITRSGINQGDV